MVGFGAARLVSDQARIFEIWRASSWAKAVSKNFAWCCQEGSRVSGVKGESADGIMPARNLAVSSDVTVSAARTGDTATSNSAMARVTPFNEHRMFIRDPQMRSRGFELPACGKPRKSAHLKS